MVLLLSLWYRGGAEPPDKDYRYLQYAMDGVPLTIFESSRDEEVWVLTDAASMLQVRWGEGIEKIIPLKKGVQGAFPRSYGGCLVWYEDGEIQGYNSFGSLLYQLRSGNGELRLAKQTRGGYTIVEKEGNRVELYSLSGNKLIEWKREGVNPLPTLISEEDLVLEADSSGGCVIRRIDGRVLNRILFPHPLRIVTWIRGNLLVGISPEGKVTTLDLEGKEIGCGAILPKNFTGLLPLVQAGGEGTIVSIDPEGKGHLIFSQVVCAKENSVVYSFSVPLDLQVGHVTALGLSPRGTSLWVGDSRWVLHWVRVSIDRLKGSREPLSSLSDPSQTLDFTSFAEQYYQDLSQSTLPQKNIQLIDEAKKSLGQATLREILTDLKRGLRTLVAWEEAGVSLRGEGILLLGKMGDCFDGEFLGERLIQEKDPSIRSKILEALYLLANAPTPTTRKDLFIFLRIRKAHLGENELKQSLALLERWIFVTGIPLQPEESEQIASLAGLSPSFSKAILEFIRK